VIRYTGEDTLASATRTGSSATARLFMSGAFCRTRAGSGDDQGDSRGTGQAIEHRARPGPERDPDHAVSQAPALAEEHPGTGADPPSLEGDADAKEEMPRWQRQ
jgi:hypothetical protein